MKGNKLIRIAIDGPAAAGKSTAAKGLATALGIDYVDTGAMYRAIALKLIRSDVHYEDEEALARMLGETDVDFSDGHVLLDGEIVDELIRSPQVSELASASSVVLSIREKLVRLQRDIAAKKSVVMDGRDIGTHVLADAEFKFFLTASVKVRAKRRALEMKARGETVDLGAIEADIEARDLRDRTRKHNPLACADDAVLIDSTELGAQDVVGRMLEHISQRREVNHGLSVL
jgi:cytidylate kinase